MEDKTFTIQCDKCKTANPSDAKFCKKCGTNLSSKIAKCKQCGTSNEANAVFCKNCGIKLAEAKTGISPERAKEWWDSLLGFNFYRSMWTQGATGHHFNNQCKQLRDATRPDLQYTPVFAIPITSVDWCIRSLIIDKTEITSGELVCATNELIIFDLQAKRIKNVSYGEISKVALNNSAHGLVQQIRLSNGSTINNYIKENSKGWLSLAKGINIIGSVFSPNESPADAEARNMSEDRAIAQYNQINAYGVSFWKQINVFFEEVTRYN